MDSLEFLYKTKIGRIVLRPLISRPVSALSGAFLDSGISKILIPYFVRKNGINTADYRLEGISSFNDFFCRKIYERLRPISRISEDFISPCDGLLKVNRIKDGMVIPVKQSVFTIEELLHDKKLAKSFDGGYCMVFRLCVNHYHRYSYIDSGFKYKNRVIKGFYHTVRPVALAEYPVFVQNSREYAVIDTDNFGRCVQMEVGAMLVGRIVNEEKNSCMVVRGEEKGHFEYGGSTIIVLVKKGKIQLNSSVKNSMISGEELPVRMGETIAKKL